MIYDDYFASVLKPLHDERRYRVFIEIERNAGRCPLAIWHSAAVLSPADDFRSKLCPSAYPTISR